MDIGILGDGFFARLSFPHRSLLASLHPPLAHIHELCPVKRIITTTKDGSHSIAIPEMAVTYHSVHRAIRESEHVYIQAGLLEAEIFEYTGVHTVLEIGFGTGLNALLTLLQADQHQNRIYYTALEPFPLEKELISGLNYCEQLQRTDYQEKFMRMHETGMDEYYEISPFFRLRKIGARLQDQVFTESFRLIYFDAFAPAAQPELWTREIFQKLFEALLPDGLLVTYCSKGEVRRAMVAAGFKVEKVPGPPGKREMLRARKTEV